MENNSFACEDLERQCSAKDGAACLRLALKIRKNPSQNLTTQENDELARLYIDQACQFKDPQGCQIHTQILKEEQRQAALDRILSAVNCAMTPTQVVAKLGTPDANSACSDNVYEAYRYGRSWVFFKSSGAFIVMDHSEYTGACIDNYQRYTAWQLCSKK